MKKIRIVTGATLALVLSLAQAPSAPGISRQARGGDLRLAPPSSPSSAVPVASVEGGGIWGTGICYGCMGMAMATLTGPIPIGGAILGPCLSLCVRVL